MTTNLKGFNTIFPMSNDTIDRSIVILDQLETDHADQGQYLLSLMDELDVKPKEAMVLITYWNGIRPKK